MKVGPMVVLTVWEAAISMEGYYDSVKLGTLPEGWMPARKYAAAMTTNDTPINLDLSVDTSGNIYVNASSGGEPPYEKGVRGQVIFFTA